MQDRSLWCTASAALVLALAPTCRAGDADVHALGHDAVTTPGVPVLLRAKFERGGLGLIRPDLVREQVEFRVLGRASRDLTDRDGFAETTALPSRAGLTTFRAVLTTRREAPPAIGRLFVFPKDRPAAVVDIDGTLSTMSELRVPFSGAEADAYPHSPELLRDLARTHAIIYLTARDDAFADQTYPFLERHRFPPGPVLFNELGLRGEAFDQLRPSKHGEFKLRTIRSLQGRGVHVVVGIGNAETDGFAYEQAGLKSYLRTEAEGEGPSFRFTDYRVLRERLVADGVLPAEQPESPQPEAR